MELRKWSDNPAFRLLLAQQRRRRFLRLMPLIPLLGLILFVLPLPVLEADNQNFLPLGPVTFAVLFFVFLGHSLLLIRIRDPLRSVIKTGAADPVLIASLTPLTRIAGLLAMQAVILLLTTAVYFPLFLISRFLGGVTIAEILAATWCGWLLLLTWCLLVQLFKARPVPAFFLVVFGLAFLVLPPFLIRGLEANFHHQFATPLLTMNPAFLMMALFGKCISFVISCFDLSNLPAVWLFNYPPILAIAAQGIFPLVLNFTLSLAGLDLLMLFGIITGDRSGQKAAVKDVADTESPHRSVWRRFFTVVLLVGLLTGFTATGLGAPVAAGAPAPTTEGAAPCLKTFLTPLDQLAVWLEAGPQELRGTLEIKTSFTWCTPDHGWFNYPVLFNNSQRVVVPPHQHKLVLITPPDSRSQRRLWVKPLLKFTAADGTVMTNRDASYEAVCLCDGQDDPQVPGMMIAGNRIRGDYEPYKQYKTVIRQPATALPRDWNELFFQTLVIGVRQMAKLTPEQQAFLEKFAAAGGRLFLIDNETGDLKPVLEQFPDLLPLASAGEKTVQRVPLQNLEALCATAVPTDLPLPVRETVIRETAAVPIALTPDNDHLPYRLFALGEGQVCYLPFDALGPVFRAQPVLFCRLWEHLLLLNRRYPDHFDPERKDTGCDQIARHTRYNVLPSAEPMIGSTMVCLILMLLALAVTNYLIVCRGFCRREWPLRRVLSALWLVVPVMLVVLGIAGWWLQQNPIRYRVSQETVLNPELHSRTVSTRLVLFSRNPASLAIKWPQAPDWLNVSHDDAALLTADRVQRPVSLPAYNVTELNALSIQESAGSITGRVEIQADGAISGELCNGTGTRFSTGCILFPTIKKNAPESDGSYNYRIFCAQLPGALTPGQTISLENLPGTVDSETWLPLDLPGSRVRVSECWYGIRDMLMQRGLEGRVALFLGIPEHSATELPGLRPRDEALQRLAWVWQRLPVTAVPTRPLPDRIPYHDPYGVADFIPEPLARTVTRASLLARGLPPRFDSHFSSLTYSSFQVLPPGDVVCQLRRYGHCLDSDRLNGFELRFALRLRTVVIPTPTTTGNRRDAPTSTDCTAEEPAPRLCIKAMDFHHGIWVELWQRREPSGKNLTDTTEKVVVAIPDARRFLIPPDGSLYLRFEHVPGELAAYAVDNLSGVAVPAVPAATATPTP